MSPFIDGKNNENLCCQPIQLSLVQLNQAWLHEFFFASWQSVWYVQGNHAVKSKEACHEILGLLCVCECVSRVGLCVCEREKERERGNSHGKQSMKWFLLILEEI